VRKSQERNGEKGIGVICVTYILEHLRTRSYLLYAVRGCGSILKKEDLNLFEKLSFRYRMVRIAEKEHLEIMDVDSPITRRGTLKHFEECVDRNGRVVLVFDGEKLIFRCCVQRGEYLEWILGNAYIRIPRASFYIEYCETHPQYRGQGICPWVLFEIRKELGEGKRNLIYIGTDLQNVSSQKGITRVGFRVKETYVLLSFFLMTTKVREKIYFGNRHLVRFPLRIELLRLTQKLIASLFSVLKKLEQ